MSFLAVNLDGPHRASSPATREFLLGQVLRLSAVGLLCSALCSSAAGGERVQPALDASEPKLGSALTLTVSGATPGAQVALLLGLKAKCQSNYPGN